MKLEVPKGTYVIAVSGGVDSMVLLDLLVKISDLKLIVAHFDHGIRKDSDADRGLVQKIAEQHKLPFVYNEGKLGPAVSESKAREARYEFLKRVQEASKADAIITAHHQDDVVETAIINMLRGTKRLGISSLKNRKGLLRPMLHIPKTEVVQYAKEHKIAWNEDSTNSDTKYLRNHVRHNILPKFSESQRKQFLTHIDNINLLNKDIDGALKIQLQEQINTDSLDRHWFVMLPHAIAIEVMAGWLREHNVEVDSRKLELLTRSAKVLEPGKVSEVNKVLNLNIGNNKLALKRIER